MADRAPAAGARLAGAMTHFATADDDPEFIASSSRRFSAFVARIGRDRPGSRPRRQQRRDAARPRAHFELVRCGIAIYGMRPVRRGSRRPRARARALSLRSYVAEVKRARAGESAGYGRRFVAERATWIATLPIGYGDGVPARADQQRRRADRRAPPPLVGTVSMDNVTVDLGPTAASPSATRRC